MVEKEDPNELWRGWVMFYQTPQKEWLPAGMYRTRSEACEQSIIYGTTNGFKTKVKRAKIIAY